MASDDLFGWQENRRRALAQSQPQIYTVTQINNLARGHLERQFPKVVVAAEISNLKRHGSGHLYFSLKDRHAQLAAVMFRREAQRLEVPLRDGMQVHATGCLTLYTDGGRFQMRVEHLTLQGEGALLAAFAALKQRLATEGLFAPERKRPLPFWPSRVAVVTSPQGAVFHDIVQVALRRFPPARILLVPCPTQGPDAGRPLAWAVKRVARLHHTLGLEVLIVARGGGSLEDLWGFNDEGLARAIAQCPIPVVSAVGHETDFTIADFVADVRAATPSAAAELVFPPVSLVRERLNEPVRRSRQRLQRLLDLEHRRMLAVEQRLKNRRHLTRDALQTLGELTMRMERYLSRRIAEERTQLSATSRRIHALHPRVQIRETAAKSQHHWDRIRYGTQSLIRTARTQHVTPATLEHHLRRRLQEERARFGAVVARLHDLSPLQVLGRGYAIVQGPNGVVTDPAQVKHGDSLEVRVARGSFSARVS